MIQAAHHDLPRTRAVLEDGIASGLHSGAQMVVCPASRAAIELCVGHAAPGVPMRPDHLLPWLSAGKPLLAAALGLVWERVATLRMDDAVARYVPEFAQAGKGAITLRHLLNHTGGFPRAAAVMDTASQRPRHSYDELVAAICAAPLEAGWVPGRRAAYHPGSSWYVLAEVLRRIDGRMIDVLLREDLFVPLGMHDTWMAMDADVQQRYAAAGRLAATRPAHAGIAMVPPEPPTLGVPGPLALLRPGASARGPARDLARFYAMLRGLGELDGVRLLRPQTVEALTARHRVGLYDETMRYALDWSLGFTVNSLRPAPQAGHAHDEDDDFAGEENDPADQPALRPMIVPYGFGPHAGSRTYGHGGAQCASAFCDPDAGLAVALIFNGMPGEPPHQRRVHRVLGTLYEELGLN